MFNNGNCGPILKFFYQVIRKKIIYVGLYTTQITRSPAICCYTTLWNSKIQKNVTQFSRWTYVWL